MATRLNIIGPSRILDALEGATIVSGYVDDDEGMHLVMQDGRVLIIAGMFAISLAQFRAEKLH